MLKYLENRSDYFKNISKLVAGTSVAQLISFLAAPLITRLYSPSDVGAFTFLISIAGGIGLVATLRYEMAVILPKENSESVNLAFLSLVIALFVSVFSTAALLLVDRIFLPGLIFSPVYRRWIYLFPALIFLMAASSVFQQWYNHRKEYKLLAYSKILTSAGNNIPTLLVGYAGFGALGLWLGNFSGFLAVVLFFLFVFYFRYRGDLRHLSYTAQRNLAGRYSYLPLSNTPQVIIEMVQSYGIVYLIKIFFTSSVLGLYSLSLRLLQAPMWLVGISIGQVFYKEASEQFQKDGNLIRPVVKTIKTSAAIAFPVLVVLMTLGPWLIGFVFGSAWADAGKYARILAPWMFFDFIRSTIHQTPLIVRKARPMFYISLIGAVLIVIPIVSAGLFFRDAATGFILLSAMQSCYSIGVIAWVVNLARKCSNSRIEAS
ncbi:MAG: oligosaccharide flippase family protein [Bacteroidetes bacterium]|nr:oligosaccharide flippase family protein [Bacteroidota bacterium]